MEDYWKENVTQFFCASDIILVLLGVAFWRIVLSVRTYNCTNQNLVVDTYWKHHGVKYICVTTEHAVMTLEEVPLPVISVRDPTTVILIVLVDTIYPVHKFLLSDFEVFNKKILYDDTFRASLWGIEFDAMTLDIPRPYAFHCFLTHEIYGCRCMDCIKQCMMHAHNIDKISDYLLLKECCD